MGVRKFACCYRIEGYASSSIAAGRVSLAGQASTEGPDKVFPATTHLVSPDISANPYLSLCLILLSLERGGLLLPWGSHECQEVGAANAKKHSASDQHM